MPHWQNEGKDAVKIFDDIHYLFKIETGSKLEVEGNI